MKTKYELQKTAQVRTRGRDRRVQLGRRAATFVVVLSLGCQTSDEPAPSASESGLDEAVAFEFQEIQPGIYHARGIGTMAVGSHGAIVENEDEVLLVDSHISPAAARAILSQVESLTAKPVRFVVDTHFHFDHAHGNQIYPPDVNVIGHETTREMLLNGGSIGRSYQLFVGGLPDQIAAMETQVGGAAEGPEREEIQARLDYLRSYWEEQQEMEPTPPNTTLSERMTLFRGEREIRLLFFGRGHTGGDVVVHLPEERVLITGDLLVPGLPFMGDGFLVEWVATLEHLKSLDFDWVLPGHGNPFQGKERITWLQEYMTDLQARAADLHGQGLTVVDAAERIDMTDHAEHYPSVTGPGVPAITVQRIWELLDEAEGSG